jgi:hypothetical protein
LDYYNLQVSIVDPFSPSSNIESISENFKNCEHLSDREKAGILKVFIMADAKRMVQKRGMYV